MRTNNILCAEAQKGCESTMTTKLTNTEIHELGAEYAAMQLIEHGISTKAGDTKGISLTLDNGKTILVRGMVEDKSCVLIRRSLNDLKSDYVIFAANLKYLTQKRLYILTTEKAKSLTVEFDHKKGGDYEYFISSSKWREYINNYSIIGDN